MLIIVWQQLDMLPNWAAINTTIGFFREKGKVCVIQPPSVVLEILRIDFYSGFKCLSLPDDVSAKAYMEESESGSDSCGMVLSRQIE